jgi:hypothetical protein
MKSFAVNLTLFCILCTYGELAKSNISISKEGVCSGYPSDTLEQTASIPDHTKLTVHRRLTIKAHRDLDMTNKYRGTPEEYRVGGDPIGIYLGGSCFLYNESGVGQVDRVLQPGDYNLVEKEVVVAGLMVSFKIEGHDPYKIICDLCQSLNGVKSELRSNGVDLIISH